MTARYLLTGIVLFVFTQRSVAAFDVFPICTSPGMQTAPAVSGNLVVWGDYRNGNSDIYGKNLATGQEIEICTLPGLQWHPAISGKTVVWEQLETDGTSDLYGYDLATGQTFPVCTAPGDQMSPAISGNVVVWTDRRSGSNQVYGKLLSGGGEFQICSSPSGSPDISGQTVVYADSRDRSQYLFNTDIYGTNLGTGQEFVVSADITKSEIYPAISGDLVAWIDQRNGNQDVYAKILSTGQEFSIATRSVPETSVDVSGDVIVWADEGAYDILGRNVISGELLQIRTGLTPAYAPSIDGQLVVWVEGSGEANQDIYGAYIPEPATLLLLATGGMTILNRRRHQPRGV